MKSYQGKQVFEDFLQYMKLLSEDASDMLIPYVKIQLLQQFCQIFTGEQDMFILQTRKSLYFNYEKSF